jgi:hypothetical protein
MKYKPILFIIGLLTSVIAIFPLASNIPSIAQFINSLPQPGTLIYQLVLFLVGMAAIGYSLKKEHPRVNRQER